MTTPAETDKPLTAVTDPNNVDMVVVPQEVVDAEEADAEGDLTAAGDISSSGMIALVPTSGNAERLMHEAGEHPDDLHATVLYLGDITDLDSDTFGLLVDELADIAASEQSPVVADGFNVSLFNPHNDERETCVTLGLSGTALHALFKKIQERVMGRMVSQSYAIPEQHDPWIPHVTLAYTDDHSMVQQMADRTGDITFDRIRLALGDDVYDFDLEADEPEDDEPIDLDDEIGDEEDDFIAAGVTAEGTTVSYNDRGGEAVDDDEVSEIVTDDATEATGEPGAWSGILIVEGVESGDGRMFAEGSLKSAPLPLPLMWQKQTDEGHKTAVQAGRIDEVWREGNEIWGRGVFDLEGEDGQEAYRQVASKFLRGVSGDVDSVKDADVEMVFPQMGEGDADDIAKMFAAPELTIFHRGRLRGATLVQFPAFVEAYIALEGETVEASETPIEEAPQTEFAITERGALEFTAFPSHDTGTSDGPWDAAAEEAKLASPMPLDRARAMYAWYDPDAVQDGQITKSGLKFPHHEVSASGDPGVANLKACAAGIGALHGSRGNEPSIPADQAKGVYDHLAKHMRDAKMEPPEFQAHLWEESDEVSHLEERAELTACGCADEAPPREWFEDPKLSGPTPMTITEDGRVFGHAAVWGTCHTGFSGQCVTPPRERFHEYFLLGETLTADGSTVATGTITLGTGHAATGGKITAFEAIKHYDNTGTVVADIATGEDAYGLWFSGALRENISPVKLRALRAAKLSGDWRKFGNGLRLVALLAVNVPGFPVPRLKTASSRGRQVALVAAGINQATPEDADAAWEREAMQGMVASLKERIGRDDKSKVAALRNRIHGR